MSYVTLKYTQTTYLVFHQNTQFAAEYTFVGTAALLNTFMVTTHSSCLMGHLVLSVTIDTECCNTNHNLTLNLTKLYLLPKLYNRQNMDVQVYHNQSINQSRNPIYSLQPLHAGPTWLIAHWLCVSKSPVVVGEASTTVSLITQITFIFSPHKLASSQTDHLSKPQKPNHASTLTLACMHIWTHNISFSSGINKLSGSRS